MKRQYVHNLRLPDDPGVYIFKDYKKKPLYIGRATSLQTRVKSYFSIDLIKTRGPRIVDLISRAKSLSIQKTDSVLEAIILESNLIKKYQPHYNVDEKDDKSSQYVVITEEEWPRVFLVRARDFEETKSSGMLPYKVKEIFGPYPYGGLIKEALRILRKLFPFKDKKAYDPRHDRFYKAIGRSPHSDAVHQYARTIRYLILFFRGKKKLLRVKIERDMKTQAREMRFEEANESKRLLYALDHINDIALIKEDRLNSNSLQDFSRDGNVVVNDIEKKGFRIEAYDVAHLSGTNVVGGMVVESNGELAREEYRKFKISKQANNDTAALAEILLRRLNHTEWDYPDFIVVDGNEIQMNVALSVLKARRLEIPVIAVTKNEKHKADRLIGDAQIVEKYSKSIIRLNAEAHRFTLAFHRKRREKI
jgi:excinuclease ABC subunit C